MLRIEPGKSVVKPRPSGDLIASSVGLHLSDPLWGEASEVFGGLRIAVQRRVA